MVSATLLLLVVGRNLKGDSAICNKCGAKALRHLAYFYRKTIPAEDLPGLCELVKGGLRGLLYFSRGVEHTLSNADCGEPLFECTLDNVHD